ncbi:MAG: hypothetical protein LC737_06260 [Chloroflexi bacterium]|nr:hypothetical protein [Chloroflexota bacterium]
MLRLHTVFARTVPFVFFIALLAACDTGPSQFARTPTGTQTPSPSTSTAATPPATRSGAATSAATSIAPTSAPTSVATPVPPTSAPPSATPTSVPTATSTATRPPTQGGTGPGDCTLRVAFVRDVTIPDGTRMPLGAPFTKKWRVRNMGTCTWNNQYIIAFVSGTDLSDPVANPSAHALDNTPPGAALDISVPMHAPTSGTGRSTSGWRLIASNNIIFGPTFTAVIQLVQQTPVPIPTPIPPTDAARSDPFRVIASYFDAINRKDFNAAYAYRQSEGQPPADPNTIAQFAAGYSDTVTLTVVVNALVGYNAGAGSQFAPVPTLLSATRTDGTQQVYVGCYNLRRVNPFMLTPPQDFGWSLMINDAQPGFQSAPLTTDASAINPGCGGASFTQAFDIRDNPHSLIGSYYDAITRRDYARAYGYWESPPQGQTLPQFASGFADTASAFAVLHPTSRYEGAAGSLFAGIPTLVIATNPDGTKQGFAGCFVGRLVNPQIPGAPQSGWQLYSASLNLLPANSPPASALAFSCP